MAAKAQIPELTFSQFRQKLSRHLHSEISERAFSLLFLHYQELRRWNPRLSLIGPGAVDEVFSRHYAESLAALSLIRPTDRRIVDIGTGGGFPGLILGIAADLADQSQHGESTHSDSVQGESTQDELPADPEHPSSRLDVTLIEPKQRKWAFLNSVIRRCELSFRCLNVRVDVPLPEGFPTDIDLITSRALTIPVKVFEELTASSPGVRILLWTGEKDPEIPETLKFHREVPLPGSRFRRIVEIRHR